MSFKVYIIGKNRFSTIKDIKEEYDLKQCYNIESVGKLPPYCPTKDGSLRIIYFEKSPETSTQLLCEKIYQDLKAYKGENDFSGQVVLLLPLFRNLGEYNSVTQLKFQLEALNVVCYYHPQTKPKQIGTIEETSKILSCFVQISNKFWDTQILNI